MNASNELKRNFREIKEALGPDWKKKILAVYPPMPPLEASSLIDRLHRLGLGRATPTPTELETFNALVQ